MIDMKKLMFALALISLISCSETEDSTPMTPVDDDFDPTAMNVTLIKVGSLTGIGHTVMGEVKLYNDDGEIVVVLDPFSSQNGPDLKVYLSKDENAADYINLGPLKSVTGKQSYRVDGMPDLNQYEHVIIWCQEFSVLFGRAELMMP